MCLRDVLKQHFKWFYAYLINWYSSRPMEIKKTEFILFQLAILTFTDCQRIMMYLPSYQKVKKWRKKLRIFALERCVLTFGGWAIHSRKIRSRKKKPNLTKLSNFFRGWIVHGRIGRSWLPSWTATSLVYLLFWCTCLLEGKNMKKESKNTS